LGYSVQQFSTWWPIPFAQRRLLPASGGGGGVAIHLQGIGQFVMGARGADFREEIVREEIVREDSSIEASR
jgi:hypothetical protein